MNRFKTLLEREWMQHQRGFVIVMLAPSLLLLLAAMFGQVHLDLHSDGDTQVQRVPDAGLLAVLAIAGLAVGTMLLAWMSALFQAPGLARRDQQDRSIEFWMSLPLGHSKSVAATLLMHLVLMPWAALAIGLAGGLLVSVVFVTRAWDLGAWLALPWASILGISVLFFARLMLGLLLCTLWLSPLILLTMAASAWLKRWGVPVVAAIIGGGGLIAQKVYGSRVLWETLDALFEQAGRALIGADRAPGQGGIRIGPESQLTEMLPALPAWLLHDAGHAILRLVSPAFALAILIGAAGFALLVLQRRRAAM